MFQTKFVDKSKIDILCSIIFFFENLAVYEIMWKNILEANRPQMTIWCMRIACWIAKATNTLKICNIYCFSSTAMVTRMRLIVTLYVH